MTIGKGSSDRYLNNDQIGEIITEALATVSVEGKRVLIIIPDGTRTMPMPVMFTWFQQILKPRVEALDYLVALGTHPPMTDAQLTRLVGHAVIDGKVGETHIFNHHWENPANFVSLGTIPAREIEQITGGLMSQDVPVTLNKLILDYDLLFICGPVFPHEVVGFSGGNKYFFPGIAGPEIINFTHWLGAVITNYDVIGAGYTPVRAVIDRAAAFIPRPAACFALVVTHEGLAGLYFGSPPEAWTAASKLSAEKHIVYVDQPFRRVLSVMPEMYDDLWTAAKGMYKMEPAVADGGEVVIYGPHLSEVSYTHGKLIDEIGYHCRDYFIKQWERFRHYPGGVLAHSTHVKGLGSYDLATGIETPRIRVTLATGIPEERCRRINLDYLNPASIRIDEWRGREHEGLYVVPRAGEILYRLKKKTATAG
ncbi:MAG: lactate racemase domain-containing protein [Acidobacteriia bacterium]|nr:lactate racemase domain-containing protein [Terriglobia bacterium]